MKLCLGALSCESVRESLSLAAFRRATSRGDREGRRVPSNQAMTALLAATELCKRRVKSASSAESKKAGSGFEHHSDSNEVSKPTCILWYLKCTSKRRRAFPSSLSANQGQDSRSIAAASNFMRKRTGRTMDRGRAGNIVCCITRPRKRAHYTKNTFTTRKE